MSRTTMSLAKWRGAVWLLGLLILFIPILMGCGESTSAPTAPSATEAAPTQIAAVEPTATLTSPPPTAKPTQVPPTNTPIPTDTPTPVPIDDSACITCHTSDETLKALAKEEEKPEVESEGEG